MQTCQLPQAVLEPCENEAKLTVLIWGRLIPCCPVCIHKLMAEGNPVYQTNMPGLLSLDLSAMCTCVN